MASSDWYVVWYHDAQGVSGRLTGPASVTSYATVKATSSDAARMKVSQIKGASAVIGNVQGPYATQADAVKAAKAGQAAQAKAAQKGKLPNLNPFDWLTSMGGGIASGIESGFVNFLKDLWDVVVGPLEVLLGAAIALIVLSIYFKDDVAAGARLIGAL